MLLYWGFILLFLNNFPPFLNNKQANKIDTIEHTGIKILVPNPKKACNNKANHNGTGTN